MSDTESASEKRRPFGIVIPLDSMPYFLHDIPNLKEMQSIVGGFIETLPWNCQFGRATIVVNEEGGYAGLENNPVFPQFVGPIILLGDKIKNGRETPLSENFIESFERIYNVVEIKSK